MPTPERGATNWRVILTVTFGGATAAMQIGKASACLPLIRAEFGTGVTFLAFYISLISIVVAAVGFGFGVVTARIGIRRAASLGLGLVAAASLAAVLARGPGALIALRLIEALGFTLCSTSMPVLIRAGAGSRRQSLALGIWAAWVPIGVAMAMGLSAVGLEAVGWRGIYALSAVLPLAALAALWAVVPRPQTRPAPFRPDLRVVLRPEVRLMALAFLVFSAAYLIFVGFLPTILVDVMGRDVRQANAVALVAMLCLVPLCILTGQLIDRGTSPALLMAVAFSVLALSPLLMLAPGLPDALRYAAILGFGAASGVPPSVAWSSVGRLATRAEEAPVLSGILYQGAGLGQVAGPLSAGFAFDLTHSWWAAAWAIMGFSGLGLALSLRLAVLRRG